MPYKLLFRSIYHSFFVKRPLIESGVMVDLSITVKILFLFLASCESKPSLTFHDDFLGSCEYTIGSNLIKLGCLRDSRQLPQPLPVRIVNKSEEGRAAFQNKEQWASFITALVCECARVTKEHGWFTFGIQNYGKNRNEDCLYKKSY